MWHKVLTCIMAPLKSVAHLSLWLLEGEVQPPSSSLLADRHALEWERQVSVFCRWALIAILRRLGLHPLKGRPGGCCCWELFQVVMDSGGLFWLTPAESLKLIAVVQPSNHRFLCSGPVRLLCPYRIGKGQHCEKACFIAPQWCVYATYTPKHHNHCRQPPPSQVLPAY